MDVFFSDIDNTLIYSHHHRINSEKIVAEYLNGAEQSYMTVRTRRFLAGANWLQIVLVTARTEEQYMRLRFAEELSVKYSLICNGGKLLVNGKEDIAWTKRTLEIVKTQLEDLEKAISILKKLCPDHTLHRPEPYMAYIRTDDPDVACHKMKAWICNENVAVHHDRRKLYLFARNVNKGRAVGRFMDRAEVGRTVAAGDSRMDVSMLNVVDYALAGEKIYRDVRCARKTELKGTILSDQICERLELLHRAGILRDK